MKEAFWGILVIAVGVIGIFLIYMFQDMTDTNERNFNLLKETMEASMLDALDLGAYKKDRTIRIDREKFVENFVRRFAEDASLSMTYVISIYDVNEQPPKASIRVGSVGGGVDMLSGDIINFDIVNKLDAILETPY